MDVIKQSCGALLSKADIEVLQDTHGMTTTVALLWEERLDEGCITGLVIQEKFGEALSKMLMPDDFKAYFPVAEKMSSHLEGSVNEIPYRDWECKLIKKVTERWLSRIAYSTPFHAEVTEQLKRSIGTMTEMEKDVMFSDISWRVANACIKEHHLELLKGVMFKLREGALNV
jgi:hypothetical protein